MGAIIIILHVIVCLILILAVLLQSGESADLAGAFGGTGSQTKFGPRGRATVLSKITTAAAIIFMITSLGMWIISAKGTSSVVGGEKTPPAKQSQPASLPDEKRSSPETSAGQKSSQPAETSVPESENVKK